MNSPRRMREPKAQAAAALVCIAVFSMLYFVPRFLPSDTRLAVDVVDGLRGISIGAAIALLYLAGRAMRGRRQT